MRTKRTGGQFTYRCDQETYEQLALVALLLKEDINSVLNRLVIEGLPSLLEQAREVNQALLAATLKPDEEYLPVSDEVLRYILIAGRIAPPYRMLEEMEKAARKAYKQPYPTREMLVARALEFEKLIGRLYLAESLAREASGPEESNPIKKIVERLRAELARLVEKWKTFLYPPNSSGHKEQKNPG
ncbi:MAG: hypothetical protein JWO38_282 [Gemmataceae bacterium]|nr:hypothetical protein [Gemmataceae bacterium]